MLNLIRRWRAKQAVVIAAKCVESSYDSRLDFEHDPDDLADLREAVKRLRALER